MIRPITPNPVAPMCAKTHEFLRLIRVLIRDMVDSLGMSNESGFVTIGELVQILMGKQLVILVDIVLAYLPMELLLQLVHFIMME